MITKVNKKVVEQPYYIVEYYSISNDKIEKKSQKWVGSYTIKQINRQMKKWNEYHTYKEAANALKKVFKERITRYKKGMKSCTKYIAETQKELDKLNS